MNALPEFSQKGSAKRINSRLFRNQTGTNNLQAVVTGN